MTKKNIEDILSGASPALKKELLDSLLYFLVRDLNVAEKKEVLGVVLASQKNSGQVLDMVEH
jgi:hypothetical protein